MRIASEVCPNDTVSVSGDGRIFSRWHAAAAVWSETHYSDIGWSLESSLLDGPKRRVASGLVGGAKAGANGG